MAVISHLLELFFTIRCVLSFALSEYLAICVNWARQDVLVLEDLHYVSTTIIFCQANALQ